jgi:hypothetical protein
MQTAIWYYSLNAPRELSAFAWTVDAKAAGGVTEAEEFWVNFVVPYLQNPGPSTKPFALLPDGDHSALRPYMKRGLGSADGALSIPDLLTANLVFKGSEDQPGLQLVDVVASAVTRAFNGTLKEPGWQRIPYLLAGVEPQVIQYGRMVLVDRGERRMPICGAHEDVMRRLYAKRQLRYYDAAHREFSSLEW